WQNRLVVATADADRSEILTGISQIFTEQISMIVPPRFQHGVPEAVKKGSQRAPLSLAQKGFWIFSLVLALTFSPASRAAAPPHSAASSNATEILWDT